MAETKRNRTRKFLWVKSPRFETRRVDGITAEETPNGAVFMKLFVLRPEVDAAYEFVVGRDGQLGEIVEEQTEEAEILEVQQGVLLDRSDALTLRDRLSEILDEESS